MSTKAAGAAAIAACDALAAIDLTLALTLQEGELERAVTLAAEREALVARLAALPDPLPAAGAETLRRILAGLPDLVALARARRAAVAGQLARLRDGAARSRRARAPDREAPRFVSERV